MSRLTWWPNRWSSYGWQQKCNITHTMWFGLAEGKDEDNCVMQGTFEPITFITFPSGDKVLKGLPWYLSSLKSVKGINVQTEGKGHWNRGVEVESGVCRTAWNTCHSTNPFLDYSSSTVPYFLLSVSLHGDCLLSITFLLVLQGLKGLAYGRHLAS